MLCGFMLFLLMKPEYVLFFSSVSMLHGSFSHVLKLPFLLIAGVDVAKKM